MKKMALGFSMILAVLGFLIPPAMAATSPPAAPALSAFLASLGTPAPTPTATRPEIRGKALCTASANCGSGGTIHCSGNNSTTSCSSADQNCSLHQRGFVTCDGVTTQCPNACPCNLDCTSDRADCVATCDPCLALFTCSLTTCTETCRCKTSGCFIQ